MKKLIGVALTAAFLLVGPSAGSVCYGQNNSDEETLKELVREWANAVVHRDLAKLDKIQADDFKGSAQGKSFDKKMLRDALQSKLMEVASWTIEDLKVKITGNTAVVSGKSTLTNAKFMGKDFSGDYEWADRFVKQKDGTWRAVHSQAKMVKK